MMKLKERFYTLDDKVKVFLLFAYVAALVFLIVVIGLGLGFFELGLFLGMVNSFMTDSLVANIKLGNKARDIKVIARFNFARNLLLSILVCYSIAWLQNAVSVHLFQIYLEPISFGLIYTTLHFVVVNIFYHVRKLIKRD